MQPDVNANIRRIAINIWTRQIFPRESIDDRVFHFHRTVLTVADGVIQTTEVDSEGRARIKHLCPVDRLNTEIEV